MLLWGWHKGDDAVENLLAFESIMRQYHDRVDFYLPSPDTAPWHVQAVINGITMNFWPHTAKAQIQYEKSVEGDQAMRAKIDECLAAEDEDFDLIE